MRLGPASRTTATRVTALITLATLVACGDSSTPPEPRPFELALAVKQLHPAVTFELQDGPAIQCGVDITAVATGTGEATWEGATFYWFAGATRVQPIDSMRVGGSAVRASWKKGTIVGDDAASEAAWDFSGRAPFEAEMHFRYRVSGEPVSRSSSLRFTCGPGIPAGGAELPEIAVTSVTGGESGEVEPGAKLVVGYAAASAFGLWITGAVVEEAFAFQAGFADRMAPTAVHEIEVIVPPGGALNSLIDLDVYALDGMLQATRVRIPTEIRLVDRTPPAIVSTSPVAAQYSVGQQITIAASATDNNALAWLIYEFGAPVNVIDSVRAAATVPATSWSIPLTVRPEWVGTTTLTVYVRDAAGLASAPVVLPAGGITVVP